MYLYIIKTTNCFIVHLMLQNFCITHIKHCQRNMNKYLPEFNRGNAYFYKGDAHWLNLHLYFLFSKCDSLLIYTIFQEIHGNNSTIISIFQIYHKAKIVNVVSCRQCRQVYRWMHWVVIFKLLACLWSTLFIKRASNCNGEGYFSININCMQGKMSLRVNYLLLRQEELSSYPQHSKC